MPARLRPKALVPLVAISVLAVTLATVAVASRSITTGRQPPHNPGEILEFRGQFEHPGNNGWAGVVLKTESGKTAFWMGGQAPGTCRLSDGSIRKPGRDGAIGVLFQGFSGAAPIGRGGSFAFTLRPRAVDLQSGNAPFVVRVTGTFYGNNVVGRLKGSSGPDPLLGRCTADARFWARRWG